MGAEPTRSNLLRGEGNPYLVVALVSIVAAQVAQFALPDAHVGPDLPIGVAITGLGMLGALVLWIPYASRWTWPALVRVFLGLLGVIWLVTLGLAIGDGNVIGISTFAIPGLVLLVLVKALSAGATSRAMDWFAWALLVGSAVSLVLEVIGAAPDWYRDAARVAGDRGEYWLPLADLVGIRGRWAGPFTAPNLAGLVGAFVLVYGITRRTWTRWACVVGGVIMLLLAGSRSAFIAAVAGAACLVVVRALRPGGRRVPPVLAWAAGLAAVAVAGVFVVRNPGLTGRLPVWPVFVDLWKSSPITGVGDSGIDAAITAGTLPTWAFHAHNVFLDAAVRYGIVAFALVVAAFVVAGIVGVRAARRGAGLSVALLAVLVVVGMSDRSVEWRYLTCGFLIFMLAVLAGADPARGRDRAAEVRAETPVT
jgi:O-antigen ligase